MRGPEILRFWDSNILERAGLLKSEPHSALLAGYTTSDVLFSHHLACSEPQAGSLGIKMCTSETHQQMENIYKTLALHLEHKGLLFHKNHFGGKTEATVRRQALTYIVSDSQDNHTDSVFFHCFAGVQKSQAMPSKSPTGKVAKLESNPGLVWLQSLRLLYHVTLPFITLCAVWGKKNLFSIEKSVQF